VKVLVTGAAGLLGREVWRLFERDHELTAVGRTQPPYVGEHQWKECDLRDAARSYDTVTRVNPDLIVNCASYNNVDGAESEPDEAYRGNAVVARNLALAAQRFDAELMHVSTDYVFDGEQTPEGGYREFDACRPVSRYGESKWWAEQLVQQLSQKFFIVRTSWLFGPGRATWIDSVHQAPQQAKTITAVKDMVSAPTYTVDLAAAMLALAVSKRFGIYHLTNEGFCSRVELAKRVLTLAGQGDYSNLKVVTQDQLRLPARRPANSGLQNLAWRLNGFQRMRPWQEALGAHFSRSKVAL
jgi:dTDP-4-dehydrorhamnose reductase